MLLMVLKKKNFKFIINSVYGKTMGNLRKRMNVRLVKNEKYYLKYTSRPTYIGYKNLVTIMLLIMKLNLTKQFILDALL